MEKIAPMFRDELGRLIADRLTETVRDRYGITVAIRAQFPPKTSLGDLAFSTPLALARQVKKAPMGIAETLKEALPDHPLVERVEVASPGYLNLFINRHAYLAALLQARYERPSSGEKVTVEHTNINPNKAAHIGHLRNAILGDTLARALAFAGKEVEVQNYIDDTGVQVADVVAGLLHLNEASWDSIRAFDKPDFITWDLYAEVGRHYEEHPESKAWRAEVLHRIEEGGNPVAVLARSVAQTIMACHLRTMKRLGIRYDLLPRESEIIRKGFWDDAFKRLKETGKIYFAEEGEAKGCWVMDLSAVGEDDKILIRSNGTLTYVAKDIAYQMWKFGLLGKDFTYRLYSQDDDGHETWETSSDNPAAQHPPFGKADTVYNVIDCRQSYLQKVVKESLKVCGFEREAEHSIHFAYEMVALSEKCAKEMGIGGEGTVGISGRKGLGVKADDLLDVLEAKCREEIASRHSDLDEEQVADLAGKIAVAAVKFFNLKFGVSKVIAFDFDEALTFEGDSGPYLQYSIVRAKSILAKLRDAGRPSEVEEISLDDAAGPGIDEDAWSLILFAGDLPSVVEKALAALDLSQLARYALDLASRFHHFYHTSPLLQEEDENLFALRLSALHLFIRVETIVLGLMGIEVPAMM